MGLTGVPQARALNCWPSQVNAEVEMAFSIDGRAAVFEGVGDHLVRHDGEHAAGFGGDVHLGRFEGKRERRRRTSERAATSVTRRSVAPSSTRPGCSSIELLVHRGERGDPDHRVAEGARGRLPGRLVVQLQLQQAGDEGEVILHAVVGFRGHGFGHVRARAFGREKALPRGDLARDLGGRDHHPLHPSRPLLRTGTTAAFQ